MNYVRNAIYTALEADDTLLALLGDEDNSIIGTREALDSTSKPFLLVEFAGSRHRVHIGHQTWAIYCYHDRQPEAAAKILKQVKDDLNQQSVSSDSDGGIAVMECEYMGDTPDDYDRLLRLDINGHLYRVYVRDI